MSKFGVGTLTLWLKEKGKKGKSCDALMSLDNWVARLEVAMEDTKEGMDLMEQTMEKTMKDLRG